MIKVSVIVPFHNVEKYISKCLTSLMYQTLENIEIICINDASTDNSKDIVLEYAKNDKRIRILNVDTMSGQSYARNLGLEVASGEYVGFVDSDDWVELDMFEKMYHQAKLGNTDITMCQAQLYDDKEQRFYTDDYYSLKNLERMGNNVFSFEETKDDILNINVVLWNKIYKREFLNNIGAKFEEGYIYEDMLFFFETYLKANRINILWEAPYYYRQNRSFSTMQNSDKKVYDRIPMVEKTYRVLEKAPFFKEKKAEIVSWLIDDIFHRYTLLEDKYYEDYYPKMKALFQSIELTEEDKAELAKSYCYDEFNNVLERSYYGFWNFLVEKYKTSNKRIKAAEHKCNLDILAIKEYLEQYKLEAKDERDKLQAWWENHCKETLETLTKEHEDLKEEHIKQEYALKAWQAESVRQVTEKLTADYEWKLEAQKQHYQEALKQQKDYYENNYFLVKMVLKLHKKSEQLQNKIKNILKKN
ncbi:MAG: glycosyltransferase [Candidatus Gastranaerophilales bacterium]|nr:glycosyltransferase [Candidatus Gastranaerophilales bacterium]